MRRGYSLLEVMAALFVTSLLMTALLDMAAVLTRAAGFALTRADLQSGALVGLNHLSRELRGSSPLTLTVSNTPVALSFREQAPGPYTAVDFTPAPTFIVYYFDTNTNTLRRKTSAAAVLRLTPAQLAALATLNGTDIVASNVSAVTIDPSTFPTTTVDSTIGITMTLQEGKSSLSMQTAVMLRNGP